MPPIMLPALIGVLITIVTVVNNWRWPPHLDAQTIGSFCTNLGTLILLYFQWRNNTAKALAETRVPGISTPEGPDAKKTTIINDPTSTAPPTITSE